MMAFDRPTCWGPKDVVGRHFQSALASLHFQMKCCIPRRTFRGSHRYQMLISQKQPLRVWYIYIYTCMYRRVCVCRGSKKISIDSDNPAFVDSFLLFSPGVSIFPLAIFWIFSDVRNRSSQHVQWAGPQGAAEGGRENSGAATCGEAARQVRFLRTPMAQTPETHRSVLRLWKNYEKL